MSNFRYAKYDSRGVGIDDPQATFSSVQHNPANELVGDGIVDLSSAGVAGITYTVDGRVSSFYLGNVLHEITYSSNEIRVSGGARVHTALLDPQGNFVAID
jgi:hypothetical protein